MTEGQRHQSDHTPAPPVSTRWSEDRTHDGDELAPPYVPTRADARDDDAAETPTAGESGPGDRHHTGPEPLPFETPLSESDATPTATPDLPDAEAEDFPFGAFEIEGEGERGEEEYGAGALDSGAWETGSAGAPLPDLHGAPDYAGEPLPGGAGTPESYDGPDPAGEVATELERMARLLRREGADGIEAEISSSDRLTAILAGMLAGYLSGRE